MLKTQSSLESYKFISKNKEVISLILICIIFLGFYGPLLKNINLVINNSDYFRTYYRLGLLRKICLEYKQFPLRNPFLSGGFPIWGDPCVFPLNPLYIFVILFGEVAGIRIVISFLLLFGVIGMFYLTRYALGYKCPGAVFSSLAFILCGWGVYQIIDGNYQKLYYYLLPWTLAFFIKASSDKKFVIFASLILSLIMLESVSIAVPVILFLFIYACLKFKVSLKNSKLIADISFFKSSALVFLFAFLLSSIKFIPMIDVLKLRSNAYIHFNGEHSYAFSSHVSRFYGVALNSQRLLEALLDSSYDNGGQMYLGIISCILFLLSSIFFLRENWRWLILLGIFIILSFGSNSPIDLFKLLWSLHPFMHSIYKLSKYFGFFIFFIISLIAGRVFSFYPMKSKFKFCLKSILFISAAAGIIIMYGANGRMPTFSYEEELKIKKVPSFFQVRVKEYDIAAPFHQDIAHDKMTRFYWLSMLQGFGVANNILRANNLSIRENITHKYFIDNKLYDELKQAASSEPMKEQELNPLYKGEAFFLNSKNYATFNYFSPNRLVILAHIVYAPDILVINQRYDMGWRCNLGEFRHWNGLMGIELKKAGDYSIRLDYRPANFFFGASISILTLFLIYYYWRKSHNSSTQWLTA